MDSEYKKQTTITIVGAGPGDPDLLTVKAVKRIQNADVVLYDNLISPEILDLASPSAQKIYVGRKYGDIEDAMKRQDTIHEYFLQYAKEDKKIVRLKSGDSFIYGRVAEEIRFLTQKKIPFEIIPGVTAGIAAANSQHIPLTERNKTNSVLFCTGHTATYDFEQLEALANMLKTGTTLIMYMGYKNLKEVIITFKRITPNETLYISAISKVSQKEETIFTGTLDEMEKKLEIKTVPMPVVFIVGKYAFPIDHNPIKIVEDNEC
ncbi:uroporphyrinogen-III C-methyltransferase [Flavobacterium columnare]|uniref:uroporphyrinogen-III C-methyltransferase n=1 Tax=Flavobacterium columnare (strain ATCC 49512 / CIP 103533 / TG 44/87) TaxID=1041826 RepID=G8X4B1_FLACA|nr:uroporphyrinogen-III C-methyltransferase [Flavobacterium columnare]AEW85336.1 uroporphyrin-III C-methyltransferase [Flavobacterium columnare ATCC 49512]